MRVFHVRAKTGTKTKMAGSRQFQCLEYGFISPNAERRDLSGSVKFFKIKETAFQELTCSILFSNKISVISVKWKAPNKPRVIYKSRCSVSFSHWIFRKRKLFFCSNGKRPRSVVQVNGKQQNFLDIIFPSFSHGFIPVSIMGGPYRDSRENILELIRLVCLAASSLPQVRFNKCIKFTLSISIYKTLLQIT